MKEINTVIILTSFPEEMNLSGLWKELLEDRLAACITTLGKGKSVYRWKQQIEEAREQSVLIKTVRHKVEHVIERIKKSHPYEVPEVVVIPVINGNPDYLNWIEFSTAQNKR